MPPELAFASSLVGLPVLHKVRPHPRSARVLCSANGSRPQRLSRRAVLKIASSVAGASLTVAFPLESSASGASGVSSAYDVEVLKDKKLTSLSFLRKKVTLFVNVASYCAVSGCLCRFNVHARAERAWETSQSDCVLGTTRKSSPYRTGTFF